MIFSFLICSGTAALVNIATGQLLYGLLGLSEGWQYSFSVAVAFFMGMVVSFALNRKYTFKPSGRKIRMEGTDFLLVSLGGLLLTTGIAQLLYFHTGFASLSIFRVLPVSVTPETLAHVAAVGCTAIYSFTAHKYISFRRAHAV